jgi:hypothetical protein
MRAPEAPRWPQVRRGRGHYESYYLRAVHPTEPRGVWIRYTVTVPPGGPPAGQLWCTLFDRSLPAPRAVRVDAGVPTTGDGAWIRLGGSAFGPGAVDGAAGSSRWSLRWRTQEEPLLHLPSRWMYSAPLPRTKLLSLSPSAVFDGTVHVDGEQIDLTGWRGMLGHNWGAEHASRWIWLHAVGFPGAGPGTWLDVAIARVRLGPLTTPWIANGALCLDGMRVPLGGRRTVSVTETEDRCDVRLPTAGGGSVYATVQAPSAAFARWDYPQPSGSASTVVNCSVADLRMEVALKGLPSVELTGSGRAVYELGRES